MMLVGVLLVYSCFIPELGTLKLYKVTVPSKKHLFWDM